MSEPRASSGRDPPPDWIERLLVDDAREHTQSYIDDAGFTARVMQRLPSPAALPAWRKPAVTLLWAAAGLGLAVTLPDAAIDVARQAFKLFSAKPFSLSDVLTLIAIAGAGTWTAAIVAWRRA